MQTNKRQQLDWIESAIVNIRQLQGFGSPVLRSNLDKIMSDMERVESEIERLMQIEEHRTQVETETC